MYVANLTIGQIAEETELGVDTIRFYEHSDLLGTIERNGSGYRIYKPSIIKRLEFIKQSRKIGFSLEEIGKLLGLMRSDKSALSKELRQLLKKRKEEIHSQMCELTNNLKLLENFLCNACKKPLSSKCEKCKPVSEIIGIND